MALVADLAPTLSSEPELERLEAGAPNCSSDADDLSAGQSSKCSLDLLIQIHDAERQRSCNAIASLTEHAD